jgi:hypothetical protein
MGKKSINSAISKNLVGGRETFPSAGAYIHRDKYLR